MPKKDTCPYAERPSNALPVRCEIQHDNKSKWDFCAHQYSCRVTGRYELTAEATTCKLRKKGEA